MDSLKQLIKSRGVPKRQPGLTELQSTPTPLVFTFYASCEDQQSKIYQLRVLLVTKTSEVGFEARIELYSTKDSSFDLLDTRIIKGTYDSLEDCFFEKRHKIVYLKNNHLLQLSSDCTKIQEFKKFVLREPKFVKFIQNNHLEDIRSRPLLCTKTKPDYPGSR